MSIGSSQTGALATVQTSTSAMAQSESTDFFSSLSARIDVDEGDMLLLSKEEPPILTCSDLSSRIPTMDMLEEFMYDNVRSKVVTFPADRSSGEPLIETLADEDQPAVKKFKTSVRAGTLRRLWECSRAASKKDMDSMVSTDRTTAPKRLSAPMYNSMITKALANGMPELDEFNTPGPLTVAKVLNNFNLDSGYQHLNWEEYVSATDEDQVRRFGHTESRKGFKIFRGPGGAVMGLEDEFNIVSDFIEDDFEAIRDIFALRANAHAIAEICPHKSYTDLQNLYVSSYKAKAMLGFRGITLNEVRHTDRVLHDEMLPHCAAGYNIAEALAWYTANRNTHKIFHSLDSVSKGTPDRGVESPPMARGGTTSELAQEWPVGGGAAASHSWQPNQGKGGQGQKGKTKSPKPKWPADAPKGAGSEDPAVCLKCGHTRSEHHNKKFCYMAPGEMQRARAQKKGSDKKGKSGGKSKQPRVGRRGEVPEWMRGCAEVANVGPSKPRGDTFCWNYHDPSKTRGCRDSHDEPSVGVCGQLHLCPKFNNTSAQGICLGKHKISECR